VEDRLLAALTMRFASTAVPEKESIERFVPKLRATAKAISDEFLRQHQSDPIDINMDDSEEL
jgi:DNA-binding IclR family transcriptional regulator